MPRKGHAIAAGSTIMPGWLSAAISKRSIVDCGAIVGVFLIGEKMCSKSIDILSASGMTPASGHQPVTFEADSLVDDVRIIKSTHISFTFNRSFTMTTKEVADLAEYISEVTKPVNNDDMMEVLGIIKPSK